MSEVTDRGIFFDSDKYGNIVDVHLGRLGLVAVLVLFFFVTFVFGGIYRIDTGQGAILTGASGVKEPVTKVGWGAKIPLFTSLDVKSIVNRNLYFPADYVELEQEFKGDAQSGAIGIDIKTTDDKVVDTGAVMTYSITDLMQYGVQNQHPEEQLQKAFDAVVFNHLQLLTSEKIINDIETVNGELLEKIHKSTIEKQYGITVTSVQLLRPTYTAIALKAMAEKQAIQAVAEGKLNAANSEALAIEKIANAMKMQSDILAKVPESQLDFNARMTLYNNLKGQPNVIWVIPDNVNLNVVAK
jgi:regulator of protease activity HflC (stomatin/prohibitin superfamily)